MSERISRIIMAGETFFQAQSFVTLAIFTLKELGIPDTLEGMGIPDWPILLLLLMLVTIYISRVSEIVLSIAFVFGGDRKLKSLKSTLWIFTFIGSIIPTIIFIFNKIFPPHGIVEYTPVGFLLNSSYFALSALIPFVHLILEKQFRRPTTTTA